MATLHPSSARSESPSWTPCTHQGHLDDLRLRQEDVLAHPFDRSAQAVLWESVGTLLNHLDGLHGDDVLGELVVEGA